MPTEFQIGDKVKLNESFELPSFLIRYAGFVGNVFHTETVMSPYSGEISQVLGIRFAEFSRHITENGSWFVKA